MKKNFSLILVLLLAISCKTAKVQENVLFSVGDTKVPTKEFLYVFNKNNYQDKKTDSLKALKEYLDLFINFKVKVKEAEAQGLDTTSSFRNEFEGYRKQLAQPYLTDRKQADSMVIEAYERLKKEINASHILIPVSPSASASDTLQAFNRIMEIREKALAGEEFGQLANKFSGDSSAQYNYGNLGYFTSMQMVYPFETAAYNTPVGQISKPVRTQFGYHIIKVNDTRESQGSVEVAHIMIRTFPEMTPTESNLAKEKVFKIHQQLENGAKWEDMVKQFSEDNNSKDKGGKLDWFSVGGITPTFENAAFALKNPGDISEPIQTPFGWHIIKLLDKKPIESFEKLKGTIRSKINRDSRSVANKEHFIDKLKREYAFKEDLEGKKLAQSLLDTLFSTGKIPDLSNEDKKKAVFKLDEKTYNVDSFYVYLKEQKTTEQPQVTANYYKDFVDQSILSYEESNLPKKYEEYRMLMKEYREGILLFSLMDEHVWSKAVKDTVGLRNFFEKNKEKYLSEEMADVVILSFSDSLDRNKTIDSLKSIGPIEAMDLKALEGNLNKKETLRVQAERDSVENDEEEYWEDVQWKTGEYNTIINGRYAYIKILDIFKPSNRNFEDIRGEVISDYQKYLEDEWIIKLKEKHPVQVNQKELEELGLQN
ncbi:MAG TPA: peptidylprolyl isomerase [Cytophagales bacterium]|nr:peptidylprolyl isomerase [Cytophagales bacterium]